jgi:hypothetical protein
MAKAVALCVLHYDRLSSNVMRDGGDLGSARQGGGRDEQGPSRAATRPPATAAGRRIVAASDDKTVIVWSDLDPRSGADDPRLWAATRYCMPLEIRARLLGFPEEQNRADLERCQRRVREVRASAPGR